LWIFDRDTPFDAGPELWDSWLLGKGGTNLAVAGGRLPVRLVSLPTVGNAVIRRYFHGGLIAPVTRDLFWGCRRVMAELVASETLRERHVATPKVLAAYMRKRGPGLFRACILTRYIENGVNLRQWIGETGRNRMQWREMLLRVAKAIASLHEAGCGHRDLNLSNILVTPERLFILDLDGARLANPLSRARRGADLLRLYRSLRKETGCLEPLSARERLRFLSCYSRLSGAPGDQVRAWLQRRWRLGRARLVFSRSRTVVS